MKKLLLFFVFSILFISGCREISTETAIGNYEWNKATPKSQNIDEVKLDLAFAAAEKLGFVDGLVIIRNGYLVGEEYYNGFSADKPHYIWSCTKSFVSAAVGIAIQKGFIESLDKKVMDYFPEYNDVIKDDRYYDITIRHLLTMTMGIDRESKIMVPVLQSYDWIRETLKLPLIYDPGTTHSYNSLQQHLISVIIKKTSGMDLYEFTETFLTLPMGIHINDWDHDPKGNIIGGYGIYLTPRSMALLGYMYLNDGKINNKQIVPYDWVKLSLTKTRKNDSKEWGALKDYNYGFLWWLGKMNGYNLFMALGMGGQYIINFPELKLIVVTTANRNVLWDNNQEVPILNMVSNYVLPAVNK